MPQGPYQRVAELIIMSSRTNVLTLTIVLVGGAICASTAASAQTLMKEEKPGLMTRAKITPDSARKLALARVPKGKIEEEELEEEHGKLVFSFDIQVAGKTGVEEVQINALTGALVSKRHESPRQQAREKASDMKSAKKPTTH